jgi:hypothetical protein
MVGGDMRAAFSKSLDACGRSAGFRGILSDAGGKVGKPGKKLSKSVVATLERVLSQDSNPREEVVLSIVDLHNIPKRLVLDWFKERREERKHLQSPP